MKHPVVQPDKPTGCGSVAAPLCRKTQRGLIDVVLRGRTIVATTDLAGKPVDIGAVFQPDCDAPAVARQEKKPTCRPRR